MIPRKQCVTQQVWNTQTHSNCGTMYRSKINEVPVLRWGSRHKPLFLTQKLFPLDNCFQRKNQFLFVSLSIQTIHKGRLHGQQMDNIKKNNSQVLLEVFFGLMLHFLTSLVFCLHIMVFDFVFLWFCLCMSLHVFLLHCLFSSFSFFSLVYFEKDLIWKGGEVRRIWKEMKEGKL